MSKATYSVIVDLNRDNTFGNTDGDITADVLNITWRNGQGEAYGDVAPPAECTLELDNITGKYNPENPLGNELITNGNFTSWSSDDPVGWTVTNESVGAIREVSEVGAGESWGETGTGACNLYTNTATNVDISQNILTPGQYYVCTMTVDNATSGQLSVQTGTTEVIFFVDSGVKTFLFVATSSAFRIATRSNPTDITIDNVSVKACGRFYRRFQMGTLLRINATFNGTTQTLYKGRITNIEPEPGSYGRRKVRITARDPMLELLDAEYSPAFQFNVTTSAVLQEILDSAVISYPYPQQYWLLGLERYTILDTSTYLYENTITNFETGITTLEYVGDNADVGEGISAQGFVRDAVAAECGGRFWFDARSGNFIFHNRHHDLLETSILYNLTAGDFETARYSYGKEMLNDVTVNYTPRQMGADGSILWTDQNVPYQLNYQQSRKVVARYVDPDNPSARVGAYINPGELSDHPSALRKRELAGANANNVPVPYIEVTANNNEDGSGDDRSNDVSVSPEFGAAQANIVLRNDTISPLYITSMRVRGTPIKAFDKALERQWDGESKAAYGEYKDTINIMLVDDKDLAANYALTLISRFRAPVARYDSMTFIANKTDDRMARALADPLGHRINLTDEFTYHDADYIVVGESHRVTMGGDHTHEVTWTLKPAQQVIGWILETVGRSELEETTYVVF